MIFALLISCIFCLDDPDFSVNKSHFLESNETDCIYDRTFSDTYTSNSVICFVRCKFQSIKSESKGGALVVSLRNNFGTENIIDNCIFTECSSTEGGSIYIKMDRKSTTKITNSIFTKNSAKETSGAIYIYSETPNDLKMQNCTIKLNSAEKSGGFIYFTLMNYSFENCTFSENKLYDSYFDTKGGSIYAKLSEGSFVKCTFINNIAESQENDSNGGAVFLLDSKGFFCECTFKNNTAKSKYKNTKGGAISYLKKTMSNYNTNSNILKCYFNNNTCQSGLQSKGGAISSIIDLSSGIINENSTISDVIFIYNSANSIKSGAYGGAFHYGFEYLKSTSKLKIATSYLFENATFINNRAYSNSSVSCGGALSYFPHLHDSLKSFPNVYFINNNFTNNTAYSSSTVSTLLSLGGAIHLNRTIGFIKNCTFNKNVAETSLSSFIINDEEPKSFGGAVYLLQSNHKISNCYFINNSGIGKSHKHISIGKGGALYASVSTVLLYTCDFINNTLIHYGHKFDIDCSIEGGACHLRKSNTLTIISYCNFINNKAMLQTSEKSNYLSAKIKGGAIFAENNIDFRNCSFKDNLVHIPNRKENEFGGSLFLKAGNITCCTFDNNIAYNGGDISFYQTKLSELTIEECIFNHDTIKNHQIKSLFHFHISLNTSKLVYYFINNKVFSNISNYLFDGQIDKGFVIMKWHFDNNCISPYNKTMFISDDIQFFDSNKEQLSFDSAFSSSCKSGSNSHSFQIPIPIITQTKSIATQTIIAMTQTQNAITHTQTNSKTSNDNQSNNSLKYIDNILTLLIWILAFQIFIILIIIIVIIFILKEKRNQNDLNPLVSDIY